MAIDWRGGEYNVYAKKMNVQIDLANQTNQALARLATLTTQLIQAQADTNRLLAAIERQQAQTNALLNDANSDLWKRACTAGWNAARQATPTPTRTGSPANQPSRTPTTPATDETGARA